jgi:hypothetical protein
MRSPYGAFKRSEVGGMLRFAPVAHSPSVRSTHRLPCLISCHERSLAIRSSLWRRNAGQKCSSQTNFGCGLLLRWLKAEGWLDRCIGGRRGKSSSKRDSARI